MVLVSILKYPFGSPQHTFRGRNYSLSSHTREDSSPLYKKLALVVQCCNRTSAELIKAGTGGSKNYLFPVFKVCNMAVQNIPSREHSSETGHANLARHLHICGKTPSPLIPLYGIESLKQHPLVDMVLVSFHLEIHLDPLNTHSEGNPLSSHTREDSCPIKAGTGGAVL